MFHEIGFHVYDIKELYFKPNPQLGYADAAFSCDILFNPLTHPFYWISPDVNGHIIGNFSTRYVPEGYGGGEFSGPRFPLWPKQRYDYYITIFEVWGLYQNMLVLFFIAITIEILKLRIVYIAYFCGILGFAVAQLIGMFIGVIVGSIVVIYIKRRLPSDNVLVNFWRSLWE
ncbi:MAG: hypothetical protein ACPLW8_03670 [Candidatus Bathyarchaeales archaeon]